MKPRSIVVAGALTAALLSPALRARGAQEDYSGQSWQPFMHAVQEYVALHHEVEHRVGAPKSSRDARAICAAVDALAAGIRSARASAKPGDILGGDTAALLRARILEALRKRGGGSAALLARAVEDEGEEVPPRPAINERYSWSWPSFAPPSILAALPDLPQELQYRFIGRDLVLVDIEANVIVDVLPDAVPVSIQ